MKKLSKQKQLINMLLMEDGAALTYAGDAKIVSYEKESQGIKRYFVLAFLKNKSRIDYGNNFLSEEARNSFIPNLKEKYEKMKQAEQNALKKGQEEARSKFIKDAILFSSWGYEQTNIDFYKIIEVNGNNLTLQQIGKNIKFSKGLNDRGTCTADKNILVGTPFKRRITKYGFIKISSFANADIYTGEELYWSSYA